MLFDELVVDCEGSEDASWLQDCIWTTWGICTLSWVGNKPADMPNMIMLYCRFSLMLDTIQPNPYIHQRRCSAMLLFSGIAVVLAHPLRTQQALNHVQSTWSLCSEVGLLQSIWVLHVL